MLSLVGAHPFRAPDAHASPRRECLDAPGSTAGLLLPLLGISNLCRAETCQGGLRPFREFAGRSSTAPPKMGFLHQTELEDADTVSQLSNGRREMLITGGKVDQSIRSLRGLRTYFWASYACVWRWRVESAESGTRDLFPTALAKQ